MFVFRFSFKKTKTQPPPFRFQAKVRGAGCPKLVVALVPWLPLGPGGPPGVVGNS